MKDSNQIINQVTLEIEASSKTSPIEAGPAKQKKQASNAHIDAVNEVFTLFRINYHNQYYKAYSDTNVLNQIKKLWLESLQRFKSDTISRAARKVIEESEYLPTLNRMMTACQGTLSDFGLKDVHSAYVEACQAPSPKNAFTWSHIAVYHAGVACDWFFLASNTEKTT